MKKSTFEWALRCTLLGSLACCACSKVEPSQKEPEFFYIVGQEKNLPNYVPPPEIFYGHENFIFHPNGKTYYHDKSLRAACGFGVDFSKPEFLRLLPKELKELDDSALVTQLQKVDAALLYNPKRIVILSSPVDTIKQKHFQIVYDFLKEKKVMRHLIRKTTDEEKVVLEAKLRGVAYHPDSVDWRESFGGLPMLNTDAKN